MSLNSLRFRPRSVSDTRRQPSDWSESDQQWLDEMLDQDDWLVCDDDLGRCDYFEPNDDLYLP